MRSKLRLSRLRDIGWEKWDPIGLLAPGETWHGKSFADEYDGYLAYAAGQLRRGAIKETVVQYLVQTEAHQIGLGIRPDTQSRAVEVVAAIEADDRLWLMLPRDA